MYVDNCLTGAQNTDKAIYLQHSMSSMMKSGGFQLNKWASIADKVIEEIKPEERTPSVTVSFNDTKSLKALGLSWETSTDCFFFNIAKHVLESKDCETKRYLLSFASKIFDPMGLLSPYV